MSNWVYDGELNRWEFKEGNKVYTFSYTYNPKIKGWTNNSSGKSYGTRRVKLPNGRTYHFATDGTITDLNVVQKHNWSDHTLNLKAITNRYNPMNDARLDSIVALGRLSGYNDKELSGMVASAIRENGGDPGETPSGRSGLFQNGSNQRNRVGTSVKSSMAAFDLDYNLGRLPWKEEVTSDSTDMNGWIPALLKIFKDSNSSARQVGESFGLGYERYTKNKEADTKIRGDLSDYIYNNILR